MRSNVAGSRYLSASATRRLPRGGDQRREHQVGTLAGPEPHAAAQAHDRIEHRARRCSTGAARRSPTSACECCGRARGSARGPSRTARPRWTRPRPRPRAPPRPTPPPAPGPAASPGAPRAGAALPSARTASRTPDARRRRPPWPARAPRRTSPRARARRRPRFVIDTRRTSASSSGETSTSSAVVMAPSRRKNSAWSSKNVTSIRVRLDPRRLIPRRPHRPADDVPDEDVRPPVVARDVLAPARDLEAAAAAVARPRRRQHHRIAPVGEQMRPANRIVGRRELTEHRRLELPGVGGRLDLLDPRPGDGDVRGARAPAGAARSPGRWARRETTRASRPPAARSTARRAVIP